ncbi:hypothetical protein ACJX0J_038597 [Zea mays]
MGSKAGGLLRHTIIESLIRYLELANNCLIYPFHMHLFFGSVRHILATDQMTSDIWGLIDLEMVIILGLEVLLGFFILILSCIYVSHEWKIEISLVQVMGSGMPYIKRVQDRHKEVNHMIFLFKEHMCGLFLWQVFSLCHNIPFWLPTSTFLVLSSARYNIFVTLDP